MTKIDATQMSRHYEALTFAIKAHDGQRDKAGEPYILHPMAVAHSLQFESERLFAQMAAADNIKDIPNSYPLNEYQIEEAVIVALLHDVVEDTDYTVDDIKKLDFEPDFEAIDCLTRRKEETYKEFIERICTNRRATKVKIADMEHNLSRIDKLPEKERGLADRYNKWLPVLKQRWVEFNDGTAAKEEEDDFIELYITVGISLSVGHFWSKRRDPILEAYLEVKESAGGSITEKYGKETLDALDKFIAGFDKEEMERIRNKRHNYDELERLADEFRKQNNIPKIVL